MSAMRLYMRIYHSLGVLFWIPYQDNVPGLQVPVLERCAPSEHISVHRLTEYCNPQKINSGPIVLSFDAPPLKC